MYYLVCLNKDSYLNLRGWKEITKTEEKRKYAQMKDTGTSAGLSAETFSGGTGRTPA